MKTHHYHSTITWTGNTGSGTRDYLSYSRDHVISIVNKPDLLGSSDTAFRGDGTKHNPEDMLLASLSVCHMLWYLHLCADAGIIITAYTDNPSGVLQEGESGGGKFTEVNLQPIVTIANADMIELALSLHEKAHDNCFIANSVNFPVKHEPRIAIGNKS